jgi:hypothetical protein
VADREPIRLRLIVDMIRGNKTACTGHVVNDYGRLPRKMSADVTRDRSCIGIETTACGKPDDNPDSLAFKRWFLSADRAIAPH